MNNAKMNIRKSGHVETIRKLGEIFRKNERSLISRETPFSLKVLSGIDKEELPPPDKMYKKDSRLLFNEIGKLLDSSHVTIRFPKKLPDHTKYSFLYNQWENPFLTQSVDIEYTELCNYNHDECPFPNYCTLCEDIAEQILIDERIQRGGYEEVDEINPLSD